MSFVFFSENVFLFTFRNASLSFIREHDMFASHSGSDFHQCLRAVTIFLSLVPRREVFRMVRRPGPAKIHVVTTVFDERVLRSYSKLLSLVQLVICMDVRF